MYVLSHFSISLKLIISLQRKLNMAQTERTFLSFFFILVLFSISSVSHSLRHSKNEQNFQVFDVSASIRKTRQVFSQTLQTQQEKPISNTAANSSVLSLSLHPRVSIKKPHHKDYSALTLSRLASDSARVNSIISKLEFALSNFTQSDLKPVQTAIQPEDLESPLISGASQGSGEYFARIGVGQPGKSYYMIIDTGSDLSWLQCQPCGECYEQADPIYNPYTSSSYRPVSCSSEQCAAVRVSACTGDTCLYKVSYGDGSYTVGELATETLTFGNSGSVSNMPIGCGHDNEGGFSVSAGIIGLARGTLSLPFQIKAASFSYCLVDRDSTSSSTLEFNSAPPGDSLVASMVTNPKADIFYYVNLIGISIDGEKLPIPESVFQVGGNGRGGIIVDSGTVVTRLETQAYNTLRDSFVKRTSNLNSSDGIYVLDTCYEFSSISKVKVPTVSFLFSSGKTLSLRPEHVMVPVDDKGTHCFAFAPSPVSMSIIGNVQQQGTRVSFDLTKRLIGFSPNKC